MHTIFRIESKVDGKGIYKSNHKNIDRSIYSKEMGKRHNNFPNIHGAFIPFWNSFTDWTLEYKNYFCAFKSIENLLDWFEFNWVQELVEELDFQLLKIKVSTCQVSASQVIFKKEDIISKEVISLEELS